MSAYPRCVECKQDIIPDDGELCGACAPAALRRARSEGEAAAKEENTRLVEELSEARSRILADEERCKLEGDIRTLEAENAQLEQEAIRSGEQYAHRSFQWAMLHKAARAIEKAFRGEGTFQNWTGEQGAALAQTEEALRVPNVVPPSTSSSVAALEKQLAAADALNTPLITAARRAVEELGAVQGEIAGVAESWRHHGSGCVCRDCSMSGRLPRWANAITDIATRLTPPAAQSDKTPFRQPEPEGQK